MPEVTVILSGMSNLEQMEDNIATFSEEQAPAQRGDGRAAGHRQRAWSSKIALPCTACHYCVSHCPQGLDIPCLLSPLQRALPSPSGGFIAPMALSAVPEDKQPSACIGCRSCEAVCPQQHQDLRGHGGLCRKARLSSEEKGGFCTMEYRKLPHGGEEISVLGLGTSALCSAGEEEIAKHAGPGDRKRHQLLGHGRRGRRALCAAVAARSPAGGRRCACRSTSARTTAPAAYGWTLELRRRSSASVDWQLQEPARPTTSTLGSCTASTSCATWRRLCGGTLEEILQPEGARASCATSACPRTRRRW